MRPAVDGLSQLAIGYRPGRIFFWFISQSSLNINRQLSQPNASNSAYANGSIIASNPFQLISTTYTMPPIIPACRALHSPAGHTTAPQLRSFATSLVRLYQQPKIEPPIPSAYAPQPHIPDYPPGERQFYKQTNRGLYGNARLRFGNNVSEKYKVKTPRKWRPNVHSRRLWAESLGVHVRTRVTTRVLRTIDKVGGLDEYLLGSKSARIMELGPWGWKLRWRVMQTPSIKERFLEERKAMGLPDEPLQLAEESMMLEAAEEGHTRETLMQDTQRVIDGEQEVDLLDEGFMREDGPPAKS